MPVIFLWNSQTRRSTPSDLATKLGEQSFHTPPTKYCTIKYQSSQPQTSRICRCEMSGPGAALRKKKKKKWVQTLDVMCFSGRSPNVHSVSEFARVRGSCFITVWLFTVWCVWSFQINADSKTAFQHKDANPVIVYSRFMNWGTLSASIWTHLRRTGEIGPNQNPPRFRFLVYTHRQTIGVEWMYIFSGLLLLSRTLLRKS